MGHIYVRKGLSLEAPVCARASTRALCIMTKLMPSRRNLSPFLLAWNFLEKNRLLTMLEVLHVTLSTPLPISLESFSVMVSGYLPSTSRILEFWGGVPS